MGVVHLISLIGVVPNFTRRIFEAHIDERRQKCNICNLQWCTVVYLRLVNCSAMVVFECIVLGSLAAVVVSELYILKKLFTENNFPYVNNSPPAPITNLFGSRSEYTWQIKGEFSWRSDAVQFSSSYNFSKLLIHYAFFKMTVTNVTALRRSYCLKQDEQSSYNQKSQVPAHYQLRCPWNSNSLLSGPVHQTLLHAHSQHGVTFEHALPNASWCAITWHITE